MDDRKRTFLQVTQKHEATEELKARRLPLTYCPVNERPHLTRVRVTRVSIPGSSLCLPRICAVNLVFRKLYILDATVERR